jgi:hypothetical protein
VIDSEIRVVIVLSAKAKKAISKVPEDCIQSTPEYSLYIIIVVSSSARPPLYLYFLM